MPSTIQLPLAYLNRVLKQWQSAFGDTPILIESQKHDLVLSYVSKKGKEPFLLQARIPLKTNNTTDPISFQTTLSQLREQLHRLKNSFVQLEDYGNCLQIDDGLTIIQIQTTYQEKEPLPETPQTKALIRFTVSKDKISSLKALALEKSP